MKTIEDFPSPVRAAYDRITQDMERAEAQFRAVGNEAAAVAVRTMASILMVESVRLLAA